MTTLRQEQEVKRLIETLWDTASYLPDSEEDVCRLIEQLGTTKNPLALEALLPYLWKSIPSSDAGTSRPIYFADWMENDRHSLKILRRQNEPAPSRTRLAAAQAVSRLVSDLAAKDLPALDNALRYVGAGYRGIQVYAKTWVCPRPPSPKEIPQGPDRLAQLGILASFHNGFVREGAVEQLALSTTGEEIPFLLWRTTDWVRQVRLQAVAAIEARLRPEMIPAFGRALKVTRSIEASQRNNNTSLIGSIYNLMLNEPATLASLLNAEDFTLRREACRILDKLSPAPEASIVLTAANNRDWIVRSYALKWVTGLWEIDGAAARGVRELFLNDAVPRLRRDALRAIATIDAESTTVILKRCLFDKATAVRQTARYHLRKLSPAFDFAEAYRSGLAGEYAVAAAAGLGETGTASDWDCIAPYLSSRSRHARVSLKALVALDKDRSHALLLKLLADERPGVRNDARRHLGYRLPDEDAVALLEAWQGGNAEAINAIADATLRLMPWPALGVLLRVIGKVPRSIADAAIDTLEQWRPEHSASYRPASLSTDMRQELLALLADVQNKLRQEEGRRISQAILKES